MLHKIYLNINDKKKVNKYICNLSFQSSKGTLSLLSNKKYFFFNLIRGFSMIGEFNLH